MVDVRWLFGRKEWRLIDQSKTHPSFTALYSFAIDDTLCSSVSSGRSPAALRTWVHQHNVVLGNRDYKLTNIGDGIRYLAEEGYQAIVRNSGGAAVVLDEGVLNISLVLPAEGIFSEINAGYKAMVELIRLLLEPYHVTVDTGEVHGSYCPGEYDVSIGGRKFGGLAQRRRRGAVAVQAFLLIAGSGGKRAELLRSFYSRAAGSEDTGYPEIIPERLASLAELVDKEINVPLVMEELTSLLQRRSEQVLFSQLLPEEIEEFNKSVESMKTRNPHIE
ncbi:lipoate--protein ligase family protein [Aneurinibacillus terranovensis]|uniref:lipoate--protein ligase family protein n=1 Tax=Aneurinibacillus terranovensis TaxID=278991 RepID=UPI000400BD81|nr:lipoate--protein ligase family protein [Aneurinibacillus terranovensis]